MAGETEVGKGEDITIGDNALYEDSLRKFKDLTGAPEGALADAYARDHLLMLYALPDPIKRRLRAMKKQQLSIIYIEADFQREVHELEMKYQKKLKHIYDARADIITGKHEPSDEELHQDEYKLSDLPPEINAKIKTEQGTIAEGPGVPNFWLTIFRNVSVLNELTFPCDLDLLKHLMDIKLTLTSKPIGFKLEFFFEPNDFFTNKVLTKQYEIKCTPDESDPFHFEGPEIRKSKGCTINWKENCNLTVTTVKKKQKNKKNGISRTVLKTIKNETFFNFFSPPEMPDDLSQLPEDSQVEVAADFEAGHYLRERVVPHAILYFTGEALEDDESYEDDDDESGSTESSSGTASVTSSEESEESDQ